MKKGLFFAVFTVSVIIFLSFFAYKHTSRHTFSEIKGAAFSFDGTVLWFIDEAGETRETEKDRQPETANGEAAPESKALDLYSYQIASQKITKASVIIPYSNLKPVKILPHPSVPGGINIVTGKDIFTFKSPGSETGSTVYERLSIPLESKQWIQDAAVVRENGKDAWYFLVRENNFGWMIKGCFRGENWLETARGIEGPYCHKKFWLTETDGDSSPEVWLQVFKSTKFYPEPENRPWLYDINDSGFQKKWQGSRLQHPFINIAPCPLPGELEGLLAVETDGVPSSFPGSLPGTPGRHWIHVYQPHVFGIKHLARAEISGKTGETFCLALGGKSCILVKDSSDANKYLRIYLLEGESLKLHKKINIPPGTLYWIPASSVQDNILTIHWITKNAVTTSSLEV